MKIYFTASIGGLKKYEKNYEKIVEELKGLGHSVIADHVLSVSSEELLSESKDQRGKHFKKVRKWISSCDVVVVEASCSSTNVGYEISMAIEREKPVLVLHVSGKVPVLLLGASIKRLKMEEYSLEKLAEKLENCLKDISETRDTRFNFFISRRLSSYLDWIAKQRRIPRAVYLRQLISREMLKHRDFLEGR